MSNMKTMGLYRNIARIEADLAASGFGPDDALTVDDLTGFDQYHYEGTDAVDDAIADLALGADARILDLGSGLGGPARYIADRTGARVTALELQDDLDAMAASLTERCGLTDRVDHRCGDMLAGLLDDEPGAHTGLVSMLCVLHIADRATLFDACARALAPGGRMVIDDYVAIGEFSTDELASLNGHVSCPYLPDLETYVADVAAAGFVDVRVIDKTESWTAFVNDRFAAFTTARGAAIERYGAATVEALDEFYGAVASLFNGGNLGGLRLTAARG